MLIWIFRPNKNNNFIRLQEYLRKLYSKVSEHRTFLEQVNNDLALLNSYHAKSLYAPKTVYIGAELFEPWCQGERRFP